MTKNPKISVANISLDLPGGTGVRTWH